MYTVKGYVGSEEKLRTYFAGCAFEKKPRVLFDDSGKITLRV